MYGARGSNGVIIITTKRGKTEKTTINLEVRTGFNQRGVPAYDVIKDPGEYYEMYWESLRNKSLADGVGYMAANIAASNGLIPNLKYNVFKDIPNAQLINPVTGKLNPDAVNKKWDDNWLKDPFRNGLRQEYNLNVSKASEGSNIYFSLSYLSDESYIVSSDFKRLSAFLKAEQRLSDNLKINGSVNYTNTSTNNVGSGGTKL